MLMHRVLSGRVRVPTNSFHFEFCRQFSNVRGYYSASSCLALSFPLLKFLAIAVERTWYNLEVYLWNGGRLSSSIIIEYDAMR